MSNNTNELKFYEQPHFINFLLLFTGITLLIFKLIFGILTNSLSLQADAYDNMTDIIMYVTAITGIIFTRKKPNEKFPYGYYKLENIISLIISIFIFITAYNLFLQSISDFINYFSGNPRIISFSSHVFIFLIVSLITSLVLTIYLKKIFKSNLSPIIESEAKEKMSDILISSSVLIGFIGFSLGFYLLDSIIGIFIIIFIVKAGYEIFISSVKILLDAVFDFEKKTAIIKLIESTPKVKKIENIEIRSYGRYIFLELELSLDKSFPLYQIDALKNMLNFDIKKAFPMIFKIIIIINSHEKVITKVAVPLENNKDIESTISEHFGDCPYFGFLEFEGGLLLQSKIIPNEFAQEEKRKGILVSEWLISEKIDKIYLKNALNKGPSIILEQNFIVIVLIDLDNLREIIDQEKS